MRYIIEIEADNDAFVDDAEPEVARIVQNVAKRLHEIPFPGDGEMLLFDINGNSVGRAYLTNEKRRGRR